MSQIKSRNSNVELIRIVAMLMIIAHHYIYEGVYQNYNSTIAHVIYNSGSTLNKLVCHLLIPGGVVGVMIFFMLAGFYGIRSDEARIKKVVGTTIFYAFLGVLFACLLSNFDCTLISNYKELAKYCFPLSSSVYWFASVYVIIMLMKKSINQFLRNISLKKYLVILIVSLVLYAMQRTIVTYYLGLFEGIIAYSIGAEMYLKREHFSKINRKKYFVLGILCWGGVRSKRYLNIWYSRDVVLSLNMRDSFSNRVLW